MKRDAGTVGSDVLAALRDDFPDGASAATLADWTGREANCIRATLVRLRTRMLVRHVARGLWVVA